MQNSLHSSNPKLLGIVGLLLFLLGALSCALVYTSSEVTSQAIHLAAGTGVLFALGLSTIVLGALGRLELRVKELEQKLAATK